jgi:hypothetical protein
MARLLINPGSPTAWEVHLKPGPNSIGRGPANDVQLPHVSVSSSHCQIIVSDHAAMLRDLGSTNGTFVNRAPVQEAELQPGQTIHLGDVELAFYADLPPSPPIPPRLAPLAGLESRAPIGTALSPPQGTPPAVKPARTTLRVPIAAPVPAPAAAPVAPAEPLPVSGQCRFHPKTPARFFCPQCQQFFCDLCVALRPVGGVKQKVCRHCGAECRPVQVRLEPAPEKGFLERVPGAFAYPVRGVGVLIVIVGIVLFALVRWGQACIAFRTLRLMAFGVILEIFAGGYLFTYLQSIIHATTAEERELPDLPGISAGSFTEDVLWPFFRLLGLILLCFGPALGLAVWFLLTHEPSAGLAFLAAAAFGCLYFPMAFLVVAVLDSFPAGNPLVVVPSILKVPLEYLLAVLILAAAFTFRWAGNSLIDKLFPEGSTIHSMGGLLAMLASIAFVSFVTLYLLIVGIHLLGLIFVTKKQKLGWLNR